MDVWKRGINPKIRPPAWEERFDKAVGSWKRPSTEPDPTEIVRTMRRAADRSERWPED